MRPMHRNIARGLATMLIGLLAAAPARAEDHGCGAATDPCEVAGGVYNMALPEGWEPGGPAVIHLHGYGGSGEKVIGNRGFVARITGRGYALIAPTGLVLGEDFPGRDWAVDDGQQYERDDVAFLAAVLDDAAARFGIDRGRVLMSGFSRGGSMVWDVACKAPGTAFAYAPASGGFWAPFPEDCAGPVRLLHTHGFADSTVPLEGRRAVWSGVPFEQSDIYRGLGLWRRVNGCGSRAGATDTDGTIWRKVWTDCTEGAALEFALHPGGHGLPQGWSAMVLDWFEAQLAAASSAE